MKIIKRDIYLNKLIQRKDNLTLTSFRSIEMKSIFDFYTAK